MTWIYRHLRALWLRWITRREIARLSILERASRGVKSPGNVDKALKRRKFREGKNKWTQSDAAQ